MGEHFLRKQAHGFRHCHDAAFNAMQVPDLLSATRPEVMTREFRCEPLNGERPPPGVRVVLCRDGEQVVVLVGAHAVGRVEGREVKALLPALSDAFGALRARVGRYSAVSAAFTVQLEELP